MEQLIEQIVNRIPTLTEAEVSAMNAAILPSDAIIEANDVSGEETLAAMAQLGSNVDPGVYSVARTAILGIIARGKVPDEVSTILVRAWTDIVEPLNVSRETVESPVEEVVEAPDVERSQRQSLPSVGFPWTFQWTRFHQFPKKSLVRRQK